MEWWIILHSKGLIKNKQEAGVLLLAAAVISIILSIFLFSKASRSPALPSDREILKDTPQRGIRE